MMWLLELSFDQNLIMINIIKGTQERHEHEGCDLFFFFFLCLFNFLFYNGKKWCESSVILCVDHNWLYESSCAFNGFYLMVDYKYHFKETPYLVIKAAHYLVQAAVK